MLIEDYKDKKVVDYLNTGKYKKVLLISKHGLGDSIMLYPVFIRLQKLYPSIEFSCLTHLGQDVIYGTPSDNEKDYDICFKLHMPQAEHDTGVLTKADKCAVTEIGITPCPEEYTLPVKNDNPFIACHFFSTCLPSIGLDQTEASTTWNTIKSNGFIPIDTHMVHKNANRTISYPFVTRSITDIKPTVETLTRVIKNCTAFIGVVSGNFWVALSQLPPERIFLFTKSFKATKLTKLPIWTVHDCKDFKEPLENFLKSLKK